MCLLKDVLNPYNIVIQKGTNKSTEIDFLWRPEKMYFIIHGYYYFLVSYNVVVQRSRLIFREVMRDNSCILLLMLSFD